MFVNGQQNFEYENYVMEDGDIIKMNTVKGSDVFFLILLSQQMA